MYFESIETDTRKSDRGEGRRVTHTRNYYLSPDKSRTEYDDNTLSLIIILDGRTRWHIFPASNEYLEYRQEKNLASGQRFSGLDQTPGAFRVAGHEAFSGVKCIVVQIKQAHDKTQTYWIEEERHLVRKWTVDVGAESHTEAVYPVVRLGDVMKPDLFMFDPKAVNAKVRGMLSSTAP